MPSRFRVFSEEHRAFLDRSLHPPILSSSDARASFLLPVLAASVVTGGYNWSLAWAACGFEGAQCRGGEPELPRTT
jgi:hypothetical protein